MSSHTRDRSESGYFEWQSPIGEFGGRANLCKFAPWIPAGSTVLDFGCGGGYLLKNLDCGRKLGIEIDPQAAEAARKNGVEVFGRTDDLPDCSVDVVISNNALEHTLSPLEELKALHGKLRTGGKLIFVVPCESIRRRYRPGDRNRHLYSWSPMCIGNLLAEAGFHVLESRPYIHKWPPGYRLWARIFGMRMFDVICRVYGRLERSWFQVRAVGEKRARASR